MSPRPHRRCPRPEARRSALASVLLLAAALLAGAGCGSATTASAITTEPGPISPSPPVATAPTLQEQLANSFPTAISELSGEYRLGPLDVVNITIFRVDEISGSYTIDERGWINIPPLGRVRLEGMTTEEARGTLEKSLGERFLNNPSIRVEVIEYRSRNCVVIGAVKTPGTIAISGPTTLIEALARSGGLDITAEDYLLVFRTADARATPASASGRRGTRPAASVNRQQVRINVQDLLQLGNPQANILVQHGDLIYVPALGSVFVRGPVIREGEVKLTSSVRTVSQVITTAFGLKYAAIPEAAFILRPQGSGNKLKIPISIQQILDGELPDVLLYNRDEIVIPEDGTRAVLAAIGNFIRSIFNPQIGGQLNVWGGGV